MQSELYIIASDENTGAILTRLDLARICTVARRTLSYRFRELTADAIGDAMQEAVCKLYERGALRSEVNARIVYTWLLTTATRELAHSIKMLGRFERGNDAGALEPVAAAPREQHEEHGHAPDPPPVAGEQFNDTLTYDALLTYLSENLADAVRLHCEGYTAEEIARRNGCSEAAAYKRVQRGLLELRKLWQEEESRLGRLIS